MALTMCSVLQLWLRLGVMAYFLFCMVLLWLVRAGTCAAEEFVATGIMPMHVSSAMLSRVAQSLLQFLLSDIKLLRTSVA